MGLIRTPPIRICQRTGFKVPASEMRQEWTGTWVWAPYWEPKHPMLDQQPPRGERIKPDATGPGSDRHLEPGEITRDDL